METGFIPIVLIMIKFCLSLTLNDECEIELGDSDNKATEKLYLMPYKYKHHKNMNNLFIKWANHLGFDKIVQVKVSPNCTNMSSDLDIVQKISEKNYNVVHLDAQIPYNYFIPDSEEYGVSVVGYTHIESENFKTSVCKQKTKLKIINGIKFETCTDVDINVSKISMYCKLISKKIEEYKLLHKIIENIDKNYDAEKQANWMKYVSISQNKGGIKKHSVLICDDNNNKNYDKPDERNLHDISIRIVSNCNKINDFIEHDVLAVLAPKPIEEEEITHLSVIFYNTPYLLPEHKSVYPNSEVLFTNYYNKEAEGLRKFLLGQSWHRVALVSDGSPYSNDFEAAATKQFIDYEVAYLVKQCMDHVCTFEKELSVLADKGAKIIIANVDAKNAMTLAQMAANKKLTARNKVVWIFRDLPDKQVDKSKIADLVSELLSIAVSPPSNTLYSEGIKLIERTMESKSNKERQKLYSLDLRNRSRILKNDIKNTLEKGHYFIRQMVNITKINKNSEEIAFYYNGFESNHTFYLNYDDWGYPCYLLKNFHNFDNYCEDVYALYFLFVNIVFVLTVSIIILFFKNYYVLFYRSL